MDRLGSALFLECLLSLGTQIHLGSLLTFTYALSLNSFLHWRQEPGPSHPMTIPLLDYFSHIAPPTSLLLRGTAFPSTALHLEIEVPICLPLFATIHTPTLYSEQRELFHLHNLLPPGLPPGCSLAPDHFFYSHYPLHMSESCSSF